MIGAGFRSVDWWNAPECMVVHPRTRRSLGRVAVEVVQKANGQQPLQGHE